MMIRSGSNLSRLNQDQYAVIHTTSNAAVKPTPSDNPDKESGGKISRKTKELEQGYQEKQRELDQAHVRKTRELQSEYQEEKQSLEREYQQKKRSLDISIYV